MERLTSEEVELVEKFRYAKAVVKESDGGIEALMSLFVGTPENCQVIGNVLRNMEKVQHENPTIPMRAVLVPLTDDLDEARKIRAIATDVIDTHLGSMFPDQAKMN